MTSKPEDVALQRENLLLTSRLVIRGLLESCMKGKNRMLASDHRQLQDFFIVVEKVLQHGLKGSKVLLNFRSSDDLLWALVQKVGKLSKEAEESVSCIQQLTCVKSNIARLRSWLRLAVMQKKLSDYILSLVECREILREFYESWSLLRSENSGVIFAGSLIGLRVIDCNLYLKEEELAKQFAYMDKRSEIDMGLYIKIPSLPLEETTETDNNNSQLSVMSEGEIKSILDQKNYLEERNRALSTRVDSLVSRLDTLEAMRKHNKLGNSEEFLVIPDITVSTGCGTDSTSIGSGALPYDQVSQQHSSRLGEMETAMSLMEKDVHEKQDTIISLRQQIEGVKKINLDLYQKLRAVEENNKQKDRYIVQLEKEQTADRDSTKMFQQRVIELESATIKKETLQLRLEAEVKEKAELCATLQAELADTRNRYRMLETEAAQETADKLDLLTEMASARSANQKYQSLKARYDLVEAKMREYEVTLEEMGVHLEESKLKADDLKESAISFLEAQWTDDKEVADCQTCKKAFSISRRKHHCRYCGGIFCETCSNNKIAMPSSAKPVRVCDQCYEVLLKKRVSVMKPE